MPLGQAPSDASPNWLSCQILWSAYSSPNKSVQKAVLKPGKQRGRKAPLSEKLVGLGLLFPFLPVSTVLLYRSHA